MILVGNKIPVAGKGQLDFSPEEGTDVLFLQPQNPANLNRKLTGFFWLTAIVLGALHVWPRRFEMFPDGVPYLDIGDAYFRGDWATAANSYWSPFYSWLLGATPYFLRPSSYWEPAAVFLTQNASEFWEENYIAEVINAFGKTSAKVIVAERAPSGIEMPGWQQIGNTEWFAFRLKS